jgi:hypothetical protein
MENKFLKNEENKIKNINQERKEYMRHIDLIFFFLVIIIFANFLFTAIS